MFQTKAANRSPRRLGSRRSCIAAATFVAALCATLICAQQSQKQPRILTVIMVDGKTGKTMIPDNFVIRFNRLDAIRNETLTLNDDVSGKVRLPADAKLISVQGAYHNNIDLYINCDAGMEKDASTLHWYPITDILSNGLSAPNECYKGKYAKTVAIPPAPGEFIFYVREPTWRDSLQK